MIVRDRSLSGGVVRHPLEALPPVVCDRNALSNGYGLKAHIQVRILTAQFRKPRSKTCKLGDNSNEQGS